MAKRPYATIVLGGLALLALVVVALVDPHDVDLPLCGFYRITGLHCPGCGMTRAVHALFNGRVVEALHQNAVLVLGLPLALYAAAGEWRRRRTGRPWPGDLARRPAFYWLVAAVALVFFIARNLPWWPLKLLAPL